MHAKLTYRTTKVTRAGLTERLRCVGESVGDLHDPDLVPHRKRVEPAPDLGLQFDLVPVRP
jgi:hypothetical protein